MCPRPDAEVEVLEGVDEHPVKSEQVQVGARLDDAHLQLFVQRRQGGKQLGLARPQLQAHHGQERSQSALVLVGGFRFCGAADKVPRPARVPPRQLGQDASLPGARRAAQQHDPAVRGSQPGRDVREHRVPGYDLPWITGQLLDQLRIEEFGVAVGRLRFAGDWICSAHRLPRFTRVAASLFSHLRRDRRGWQRSGWRATPPSRPTQGCPRSGRRGCSRRRRPPSPGW